jgi:hypothetical protein
MPAQHTGVRRYPLVRQGAAVVAGLVAIVRRLAIARTISEVTQITTQAARSLLRADGVTFILRDGDLCYYAEEDAVSPLWKGHRFPMSACISGWCMTEEAYRDVVGPTSGAIDLERSSRGVGAKC